MKNLIIILAATFALAGCYETVNEKLARQEIEKIQSRQDQELFKLQDRLDQLEKK